MAAFCKIEGEKANVLAILYKKVFLSKISTGKETFKADLPLSIFPPIYFNNEYNTPF